VDATPADLHVYPEKRFERIWKIVAEFRGGAPYPTVTAVGVAWLYGFQFEMKVTAKLLLYRP
jgi:hypothetical protein